MVHSLISREHFRCATDKPFVRHDTRVWESSAGREPRLRGADGQLLLGDEVFEDWRVAHARAARCGCAPTSTCIPRPTAA